MLGPSEGAQSGISLDYLDEEAGDADRHRPAGTRQAPPPGRPTRQLHRRMVASKIRARGPRPLIGSEHVETGDVGSQPEEAPRSVKRNRVARAGQLATAFFHVPGARGFAALLDDAPVAACLAGRRSRSGGRKARICGITGDLGDRRAMAGVVDVGQDRRIASGSRGSPRRPATHRRGRRRARRSRMRLAAWERVARGQGLRASTRSSRQTPPFPAHAPGSPSGRDRR